MALKRQSDSQEVPDAKVLKNNLSTYFRRQVSGFYTKTGEEDRQLAKKAQAQYKAMSDNEKLEFAQAFQSNKHNKISSG